MNRQEKAIVAVLILFMVAYMGISMIKQGNQPVPPVDPAQAAEPGATNLVDASIEAPAPQADPVEAVPSMEPLEPAMTEADPTEIPPAMRQPEPAIPETIETLENQQLALDFSSRGGTLRSVTMKNFKNSLEDFSGPFTLNFSNRLALAINGIPELDPAFHIDIRTSHDRAIIQQHKTTSSGLDYRRSIELKENYHLAISETFSNTTAAALHIPVHQIQLGSVELSAHVTSQRGMAYLGIDTLASQGGEKVRHHGKPSMMSRKLTLMDRFTPEERRVRFPRSCALPKLPAPLPDSMSEVVMQDTDWVAVKSKFFVQILSHTDHGAGYLLQPRRLVPETEEPDNPRSWMQTAVLKEVGAAMVVRGFELEPGQALTRDVSYYIGPKKHKLMKQLGHHQEDVMEFGKLKIVCEPLLKLLNLLHKLIPNYGVAIILLTIIIKVVFWPITHKSTEQMKKMATLQPEMKELQAKFKDKPQKLQQETMALYKLHKVNPMAGCLPMVIQIPVFISLFTVLRSAVELRYAGFLWIPDLSEPEGLFREFFTAVPYVSALNILPIFMTVLTFLQQKLTPSSVDPQQQKIMMMMPVVFLFILYNMASGLVLYWSVNQVLSILQLVLQKKVKAKGKGAGEPDQPKPRIQATGKKPRGKKG
ncbi:MAG: YidC/Oxa1 family insertase periplasmic-domain containing protein [Verrucomicrobia bacterium]|nr:YidC/Oxa1 family insertase periplasmic-domain containing protein [Verrucomicrobiota bacterium]MDA1088564.1 YidC/Oxa1 family insertase periplasmic-domain containing protein [Verrucomicrobiota bacterium]